MIGELLLLAPQLLREDKMDMRAEPHCKLLVEEDGIPVHAHLSGWKAFAFCTTFLCRGKEDGDRMMQRREHAREQILDCLSYTEVPVR